MQCRKFGKLDWKGAALGFGAMRFPVVEGRPQNIPISEWMPVVHQVLGEGKSYDEVSLP
jgi:predicted aldo/keto reductase-like oxidoreductase